MGEYQLARDRQVLPMYEFTNELATLDPPPPELQQLLGAVHGNQEAMDGFARVTAGVTSPAEFFSDENVGRIFAAAAWLTGDGRPFRVFRDAEPSRSALVGVSPAHRTLATALNARFVPA